MKHKKYVNQNLEPFYILHLPGKLNDCNNDLLEDCATRKIKMHDDISVISLMNEPFWNGSPLVEQCKISGIKIYNSAYDEKAWSNILKLIHIQISLEEVKTKYALFLDGRDVGFVNDIDDEFLEKYKSFHFPIVYNGTSSNFPIDGMREPLDWLLKDRNRKKFLNAGVCIGEVNKMKDFYNKALILATTANSSNKRVHSEQFFIRLARVMNPTFATVDSGCKLFASAHGAPDIIRKENEIILC